VVVGDNIVDVSSVAKGIKALGPQDVIRGVIEQFPKLKDNPHYRPLGSIPTFYRVYEYLDAQPPYSWEGSAGDRIQRRTWEPESRVFEVHSAAGGLLALHEQFFPGWTTFRNSRKNFCCSASCTGSGDPLRFRTEFVIAGFALRE